MSRFNKEPSMNKFFVVLSLICSLSIGLASNATVVMPYEVTQSVPLGGNLKVNGFTDVVTLPSTETSNFWNDFTSLAFQSVMVASAHNVSRGSTVRATVTNDPYIIPIDGVNYVMVKDKSTNDWSEKDLLGYDDPKNAMFTSLKNLESDGNRSNITPDEIKKAGVRLVKLAPDGTLLVNDRAQDLNLNRIKYIDTSNLKRTANSQSTGIFGHFYVYLNTDDGSRKMAVGYVTFDTHSNLKIMFQ